MRTLSERKILIGRQSQETDRHRTDRKAAASLPDGVTAAPTGKAVLAWEASQPPSLAPFNRESDCRLAVDALIIK